MEDLAVALRDPIWQFIGAIIALVALIVPLFIYFFLQRRKKSLVYEILTQTRLLTADEEIAGDIRITYKGDPVGDVHLATIRIKNNGTESILASDFVEPLEISFHESIRILSIEIIDTDPESLTPQVTQGAHNKFLVSPTLLNGKDSFVVKSLIASPSNISSTGLRIDARIVGVRKVEKLINDKLNRFNYSIRAMLMLMIFLTFLGMGIAGETVASTSRSIVGIMAGGAMYGFLLWIFYRAFGGMFRPIFEEYRRWFRWRK